MLARVVKQSVSATREERHGREVRRLHPEDRQASAWRRTTSRPSRRCWAPSWSTTRPSTGSRTSSSPSISTSRSTAQIYEVAGKIIRAGKTATRSPSRPTCPQNLIADVTMPQYLARLAAEATTVINAADYGQPIYDLALRRKLILIGEEMVSTAYDADVDLTPRPSRSRKPKSSSSTWPKRAATMAASSPSTQRSPPSIQMAGEAYQRDGTLSGTATGLTDLDRLMGGLQRSDLIILAARPAMGKTVAGHQHRLPRRQGLRRARSTPDGHTKTVDGGQVGFFSPRNERRAAGDAYPRRAGARSPRPTSGAATSTRASSPGWSIPPT